MALAIARPQRPTSGETGLGRLINALSEQELTSAAAGLANPVGMPLGPMYGPRTMSRLMKVFRRLGIPAFWDDAGEGIDALINKLPKDKVDKFSAAIPGAGRPTSETLRSLWRERGTRLSVRPVAEELPRVESMTVSKGAVKKTPLTYRPEVLTTYATPLRRRGIYTMGDAWPEIVSPSDLIKFLRSLGKVE